MNQYDLTAQLAHIYRKGSFSSDNGHKPIIGITANYGEQNAKLAEGYYKQVAQAAHPSSSRHWPTAATS